MGAVDIGSPTLGDDLHMLRKLAAKAKIKRVRSKLIIPDGQIKYLTIDTGDIDEDARREAAQQALEGATPYPVDKLAFDISAEGAKTHIAAVARETLAEAEAFAVEHKFNPVSFVAAPEDAGFLGEPFFGQTEHAAKILKGDATVVPDGIRVVVVSHPDQTAEANNAPENAKADIADSPAPAEDEGPTPSDAAPEADDAPQEPASESAATFAEPRKDADAPKAQTDESGDAAKSGDADTLDTPDGSDAPKAGRDTTPVAASTDTPHADSADDGAGADADTAKTPALMGFASRRRGNGADAAPPAALGGVTRDPPDSRPARRLTISDSPNEAAAPPPPPALSPQQAAAQSLRAAPPIADVPAQRLDAEEPPARKTGFLSRRKPKRVPPAPPSASDRAARTATAAANAEAQRMTVFGARSDVQVGGKPRFLGLILTAILLVFLAGVAAWASVFLDEGLAKFFPKRERTLASTLPADAERSLAEDVGATVELEPTEQSDDSLIVASLNEGLSDGLTPEEAAVLDALRNPQPDPTEQPELDQAALEARYAVTGIWPKAPDIPPEPTGLIQLEDLYVTGIDPVSPALDAIALPDAGSFVTDVALPDVASPPAAGTRFAFDADGRVVPTVEGALTPEGFTVFLGRPPVLPPADPRSTAETPEAEPETLTPDTRQLAGQRPRARPSDLVEQNERATFGGLSRSELAELRPRLRPAAPQEIATAVPETDTAAVDEAVAEANAAASEPISPLATAQSYRPQTRPRNFARTVARATSTASAASAAPQRVAAVAPRTVTPAIPSTASVAREATVRNAINLSRVNLIGVYGTPSNRRALVRLRNGRYQKVAVGDRFDGGRVSAIGDSELRYQKGNRNLILKMPN